jgi:catechol 2,3-dioxygenase-like lactoylglutathione lyase family enzyme
MIEANLTRFGPKTLGRESTPSTYSATFKAIAGAAKLLLQNRGLGDAQIKLNGHAVMAPPPLGEGEIVVPLNLERENTLSVNVPAGPRGTLVVRVTQLARADLGLQRQGYFGLNTSDMARQRAFYETLGFKGEIFPAGPERSTSFARSLGFADDYLIYVALTSLENPPVPPFVDTVQFRGDSYRDEPPYAQLNHIGMAYATYATRDLDGYVADMRAKGVSFVSAPATAPNGERFVFLKEPDGAFLKLVETAGEGPRGLVRLLNTNMNVSDLERSREFYRLLGFTESAPASQAGSGDFAAAHGFGGSIEFDGVDISLGEGTDGATLQLRRWQRPYDDAPPYAPPVNHLGIDRINFYVKNLTASIQAMRDVGFEPLWPIGGSPEFGIVFFFDPDGIKVQIAGPRTP